MSALVKLVNKASYFPSGLKETYKGLELLPPSHKRTDLVLLCADNVPVLLDQVVLALNDTYRLRNRLTIFCFFTQISYSFIYSFKKGSKYHIHLFIHWKICQNIVFIYSFIYDILRYRSRLPSEALNNSYLSHDYQKRSPLIFAILYLPRRIWTHVIACAMGK